MTVLTTIQKELEELYELTPSPRVEDFLVSREMLHALYPPSIADELQETLLLEEKQPFVHVGLYVAPPILELLEEQSPWRRLTATNLEPFCSAVEGVSHFLFLLSRCQEERPVSQLEMELQAEIDKYLLCSLLLERQRETVSRRLLPLTLFDNYQLLKHLTPAEVERYHLANRIAFQYCRRLQRITHPTSRCRLVREVRRFRGNGLQGKIHLVS